MKRLLTRITVELTRRDFMGTQKIRSPAKDKILPVYTSVDAVPLFVTVKKL
jgi:hypothetical protein